MSRRSKTIIVLYGLLIVVVVVAITLCSGCAAKPQFQPTNASVNVGNSFAGTWAHLLSARYDNQQAKKFNKDAIAVHFMDATDSELGVAFEKLTEGMQSHESEQNEHAAAHVRAEMLERDIRSLKESDRWRYGGWCIAARFVLRIWIVLLILCWLGMFYFKNASPIGIVLRRVEGALNVLRWPSLICNRFTN